MRDKLILKAEALFLGKRPAYRAPESSDDPNVVNLATRTDLDGYLDLYLGAEYRYTKRLSVFLGREQPEAPVSTSAGINTRSSGAWCWWARRMRSRGILFSNDFMEQARKYAC